MNKTIKYLSSAVLFLAITLAASIGFGANANSLIAEGQSTGAVLLLAQAESCLERCETSKKSCMAKYIRTNINGVKFVTPEGVKLCGAAYRECKSYCK